MKQSNEQKKKLLKPYSCPYFRMIDLAGLYYCDGRVDGVGVLEFSKEGNDASITESSERRQNSSIWDEDEVVLSKDSPF